jgi:uncharacterized protein YneR
MNITLTPEAQNWVKREFAPNGKYVRVYVKYGQSAMHPGFTLGMTVESPRYVAVSKVIEDVTIFIKEDDMWYFNDLDLYIHFNEKSEDVIFNIK